MNFQRSTPVFRSVSVAQPTNVVGWPSTASNTISFAPRFEKKSDAPSFPPPPPRSFRQQPSLVHSNPKVENTKEGQWVWNLASVSPLPIFHPVQDWNTMTIEHLSLGVICSRISEFLRQNPIAAEYNDDEGLVRCRTLSRVEFVVNIWQKPQTQALLVHFQHVSGSSMELALLRTELKNAILATPSSTQQTPREPTFNQSSPVFRRVERCIPSVPMDVKDMFQESPLELCKGMLLDSQQWSDGRLGLETLAALTDKSKTVSAAASEASGAVLSDCAIQDILSSHLKNDTNNGNHVLALQILAQSLQNSQTTTPDCSANPSFWQTVLVALLDNIRRAASRPLEACLSVRCLGCLMNELSTVDATSLDEYLQSAYQFGCQHNTLLQNETEQLLRCRAAAR